MDTEHLLRDAVALAFKTTAAGTLLIAVAAGLFVILRTNSLHVLRTRVWHLVMGKRDCRDEDVARAIRDRDDLVQFRHFLGIQARTVGQAAAIARWARDNNEDPDDIYECGELFDLEACELKKDKVPGTGKRFFQGAVWVGVFLYVTSPWIYFAPRADEALVPVDKSLSTWVWLSETRARSFWGGEILTAESCPYGVKADVPQWPEAQAMDGLCDAFVDPAIKPLLQRIIGMTRFILFTFTAPALLLLWSISRWVRAGAAGSRMLKRIEKRSAATAKTEPSKLEPVRSVGAPSLVPDVTEAMGAHGAE